MAIVEECYEKYSIYTEGNLVLGTDEYGCTKVIGKIDKVELSCERPRNMEGIYRVQNVLLFNEDEKELYDDQSVVDNQEYFSEEEMAIAIAKHYNVSRDKVEMVYECFE